MELASVPAERVEHHFKLAHREHLKTMKILSHPFDERLRQHRNRVHAQNRHEQLRSTDRNRYLFVCTDKIEPVQIVANDSRALFRYEAQQLDDNRIRGILWLAFVVIEDIRAGVLEISQQLALDRR